MASNQNADESVRKEEPVKVNKPTDDELADSWIEKHPNNAYGLGCFRVYDRDVWKGRPTKDVENEILNELEAAKEEGIRPNISKVNSVRELIKIKTNVPDSKWDNVTGYFPLQNGLLDLNSFQLIPLTPGHHLSSTQTFDYDPSVKSPFWHKALSIVDEDVAYFFQEFAGYCLLEDTNFEIIVWLLGPSGSGKSTLIGGLVAMLGPRACSLGLREMENSRFNLSNLVGKTLMAATEQPRTWINVTDIINRISSGEKITVEKKGKDSFEMTPHAKMIFASTEYPSIPSIQDGIYRRLRVIHIPAIPEKDRDPSLKDNIYRERSGILNWAIEGLKRLRERGNFQIPASIYLASENYKQQNDLSKQFLDECCETGPSYQTQAQLLYDRDKRWREESGYPSISMNCFAEELKRLGFTRKSVNGKRYWVGLKLEESEEIQHEEELININREASTASTSSINSSTLLGEWYTSETENSIGGHNG